MKHTVAFRAAAVALTTLAAAALTASPADAAIRYTPGSAGIGDPYFPLEGNGGYDAGHYDLDLAYDPGSHDLAGTVRMDAKATQNLSRFDLDFSGMHVSAVTVDGAAARFTRNGQELVITPRHGLRKGATFTSAVTYAGSPRTVVGSPIVFGADYGWQYTPDGAFVGDEPNAAHTWFPVDDHPRDKATYTYSISVPSTRKVVANGDFVSVRTNRGRSTWVWHETSPMASYLATIDIGNWEFRTGHTRGGVRELMAVDPALTAKTAKRNVFGVTGAVTDYWAKMFGRYPFTSTGAIVDNVPDVGFSLETQTRPLYGFAPDSVTVSHELAHQWFGDSVSVHSWRDIWLNEGFATFAEWLWAQHTGGPSTYRTAKATYDDIGASSGFWKQSIADPKRNTMFSAAVYQRGGMTLAVLRHRLGDATFFRLMHRWSAAHRYGTASTSQFVALASRVSHRDLRAFFHTWLWAKAKPAHFG